MRRWLISRLLRGAFKRGVCTAGRVIFLTALLALQPRGQAHETITTRLTWSREISRIFAQRCWSCHRDRGAAPMALISYEQARPWAVAIKDEVLNRRMPPWGAVKGFGDFSPEAGLSQEEISRIADWVEGGAPEGEAQLLPSLPLLQLKTYSPASERTFRVRSLLTLQAPAVLSGLRPEADVLEARVIAQLPDGAIRPLLWLRGYSKKWNRTFVLREPLALPSGTRIRVAPPAPIRLVLRSPAPPA